MEKKNDNNKNKNKEDSLELINKLKNLRVSLENEKSFSNILQSMKLKNKNKNSKKSNINNNTERIRSRNENIKNKGSISSRDINTVSTKSTGSNIYHPNVYYINQDNNLHKKIHFSTIFSQLKQEINI